MMISQQIFAIVVQLICVGEAGPQLSQVAGPLVVADHDDTPHVVDDVVVKVEKSSTVQCVGTTNIVFDQVLPCFGCRRTISKYYCLTMLLFSDC